MKKKATTAADNTASLLQDIKNEITSSNDFILSYIRTLAILHDGRFHLDELKELYGWKMAKVLALSAAINHFCARGLLKRGADSKEVLL